MNKRPTSKPAGRHPPRPSHRSNYLARRIEKVRCVLTDVDGVLTDGKLHITGNGDEFKSFDVQDGHGIAMARRAGLIVGFVSGRPSRVTEKRAAELGVEIVMQGPTNKMEMVEQIKKAHGLTNEEICFIGDELVDLPVLRRAGLAVAVPNAMDEVKAVAHYITRRAGGNGAVREVLEMILKGQGTWARVVAKYMAVAAVILSVATASSRAGDGPSSDNVRATGFIERFEVPETDEQGNLKWKLFGERARLRSDGLMDVYNMRAEFFSDNKVTLVFITSSCLLDRVNKKATTDAPVRIERDNMVLTGTGGEWSGETATFVVRHDVRMEIKMASELMKTPKSAVNNGTRKEP
jgi:3-deoxy-D-manno-octulosonate 8-phosphate phosphatase (KDO 8-P phosphatase)